MSDEHTKIDIRGKKVAEALAEVQFVIVRQALEQAYIEMDKLEKLLMEVKRHEKNNFYHYDSDSFRFLR